MSYDENLEEMLILRIGSATGKEDEALEAVQKNTQSKNRNLWLLPIDMEPSKEDFESLGFIFFGIENDNVQYQAKLPEGWKIQSDEMGGNNLIDDKGRLRGNYFLKDAEGCMVLRKKFRIAANVNKEGSNWWKTFIVSVKDFDDSILFIAGECESLDSQEYKKLHLKAKNYLKSHYPEWENPIMYWD